MRREVVVTTEELPKVKRRGAGRTSAASTWLARPQVAALAGVTEEQVEVMHGRDLHPVRAKDRSWRYPPREVAALVAGGSTDGVVTAKVFSLFKQNVPMADVVIQTQQTVVRVKDLRAEYDELVGGLHLEAAAVAALGDLLGADTKSSSAALLAAVKRRLEERFREGFREGQDDVEDFGEVVDAETGERRRVTRSSTIPEAAR
jgi:hypothetical protein